MLKYFDGDQSNACNNNYNFGQVIFNSCVQLIIFEHCQNKNLINLWCDLQLPFLSIWTANDFLIELLFYQ
jgi:hypothetical protein